MVFTMLTLFFLVPTQKQTRHYNYKSKWVKIFTKCPIIIIKFKTQSKAKTESQINE